MDLNIESDNQMANNKVIAFYLPQYHPTPDNNKWWGKGFTEWTNVGKAKPLFRGHYQPRVPADLGYYDLRLPEVREAQAELAKEAGIFGFCYYHYWFGNGKEELELPFNEVLRLGKPDFPFMLCWANESWHKKFWNKDGKGTSKEVLIEQLYPGVEDHISHFYRLLPAFKDKRYIKIDGKPAFMIYKPNEFPGISEFIKLWDQLAVKEGFEGMHIVGHTQDELSHDELQHLLNLGLDSVNTVGLYIAGKHILNGINMYIRVALRKLFGVVGAISYKKAYPKFLRPLDKLEVVYPTIIPNWDHSPRSGKTGFIIKNSTPELFARHIRAVLECIKGKKSKIAFLKSWNEWGEGNYMEPDLKYGKGYIKVLRDELDKF